LGAAIALSGLLAGFGACWSIRIARQVASGGTTDNADFWIAGGIVPLTVGCGLIALIAARWIGSRMTAER
jgi:hypothetical protein